MLLFFHSSFVHTQTRRRFVSPLRLSCRPLLKSWKKTDWSWKKPSQIRTNATNTRNFFASPFEWDDRPSLIDRHFSLDDLARRRKCRTRSRWTFRWWGATWTFRCRTPSLFQLSFVEMEKSSLKGPTVLFQLAIRRRTRKWWRFAMLVKNCKRTISRVVWFIPPANPVRCVWAPFTGPISITFTSPIRRAMPEKVRRISHRKTNRFFSFSSWFRRSFYLRRIGTWTAWTTCWSDTIVEGRIESLFDVARKSKQNSLLIHKNDIFFFHFRFYWSMHKIKIIEMKRVSGATISTVTELIQKQRNVVMSRILRSEFDRHTRIESIRVVRIDIEDQTPLSGLPLIGRDELQRPAVLVRLHAAWNRFPFSILKVFKSNGNIGCRSPAR